MLKERVAEERGGVRFPSTALWLFDWIGQVIMRRRTQIAFFAAAAVFGTLGFLMLAGRRHPSRPIPKKTVAALPAGPLAGVVVVLDPGHGGADPGTTAGPLSEAALSYRMASELAASLKAQDAQVVFTVRSRCLNPALALSEPPLERPADAVMAATGQPLGLRHSPRPLWQRAQTAGAVWAERHADPHAARDVFFLSLHFDQFHADTVQGGTVCVDRRCHPVPLLARALAGQMTQDNLCRSTEDFHGIRGLAGRELGVLDPKYNPVPQKALLEIATLSNPANAIEAGDAAWRGELVQRITLAITQAHQQ